MVWIALLLAQAAVPSQTDRGEALFFDAEKGCASCHALKGKGTAVGPDRCLAAHPAHCRS